MKVPHPIVRNEEGPNSPIPIVSAEVPLALIEPGKLAIPPHGLENGPSHRSIPQALRQPQILLLRDRTELAAMLAVVLVELASTPKAGAGTEQQRRKQPEKNEPTS